MRQNPEGERATSPAASATHLLSCRHCLGSNQRNYFMRCEVLGETSKGQLKVKVYGRLFWKGHDDIARIRYVDRGRVRPIQDRAEAQA